MKGVEMEDRHRQQLELAYYSILKELAPTLERRPELLQDIQQRLVSFTEAWGTSSPTMQGIRAGIDQLIESCESSDHIVAHPKAMKSYQSSQY
jgi:hypothetical protein